MRKQILFIRKNTPELISRLFDIGFKHSTHCNDGTFIAIENGLILQVSHTPYSKHIDFQTNDKDFLHVAEFVYKSYWKEYKLPCSNVDAIEVYEDFDFNSCKKCYGFEKCLIRFNAEIIETTISQVQ